MPSQGAELMANQGEVDKKIQDRLDEAAAAKAEAEAQWPCF